MFCSNCGQQISESAAFCSGCGAKAGTVINAAPVGETSAKKIAGEFTTVTSKIPLMLAADEVLIEQESAAFVLSSIAQGTFSLTNKRIIFTKDSAGKAFMKRGGLIGMALSSGAKVPEEILLDEIRHIEATSCLQGKAAMLITIRSGYQYKIALQSMSMGKTAELCRVRDRVIELIGSAI